MEMDNNFKIDLKGITPIKSSFQKQPTVQSDVQYDETRNIDNAKDPAEFLGRSQVSFRHKNFISHDELKQKILDIIQDYMEPESAKNFNINFDEIAEDIVQNCKTDNVINNETADAVTKLLQTMKSNTKTKGKDTNDGLELQYFDRIANEIKNSTDKKSLVQFAELLIKNKNFNNSQLNVSVQTFNSTQKYLLQNEKKMIFDIAKEGCSEYIENLMKKFPTHLNEKAPERILYLQIVQTLKENDMKLFDEKYWNSDISSYKYDVQNMSNEIIKKALGKLPNRFDFADIGYFKQKPKMFLDLSLQDCYYSTELNAIFKCNEKQNGFIEKLLETLDNTEKKDPILNDLLENLESAGVTITKKELHSKKEEFLYRLYELQKKSPQIVAKIIAQLESMPNIDYGNYYIRKNSKETIVYSSLLKN